MCRSRLTILRHITRNTILAEALSAIAEHHADLLITDYQMPIMGGLELVRTLRAQGAVTGDYPTLTHKPLMMYYT